MNNFKPFLLATSDNYWVKRTHVHGLESDAIVKLYINSTIHKIQIMLAETSFYFYVGVNQFLATIQEGLALIHVYRLCLRNKDIFAEDSFAQVLIAVIS